MSGWICLHRDIQNHWIFSDAERFRAWVDLIMLSNHEDNKFMINDTLITVTRGQLAWSQLSLSNRWKWTRQKTRTFLKLLQNESMIDTKSNHHTTIITICNYSQYQDSPTNQQPTNNQPITNQQPTLNQPITTDNNVNNVNKKEKSTRAKIPFFETVELPFFIDRELFIGWQRERKKQHPKAAQTEYAINQHISELSDLEMSGYPANACLVFIRTGIWQGVNKQVCIDKMSNNGQANSNKSYQQQEREHSQKIQDAINSMDF